MEKSQKQQVREWLESGKSLTPKEAYRYIGSMRLAAIIEILRNKENMNITDLNKNGNEKYSNYKLVSGQKLPTPEKPIEAVLIGGSPAAQKNRESAEKRLRSASKSKIGGCVQVDFPCPVCGSYYRRENKCNICK